MTVSSFALCSLLLVGATFGQHWSNFNCPAPRSPKNGLSFIFQQGKEVHFKCHPGYTLVGIPVAKCLNNQWDSLVPDCIPEKKENSTGKEVPEGSKAEETSSPARPLFSWDNPNVSHVTSESGSVPESRRLPLINGLWKSTNERRDRVYEHPNSAGWSPERLSPLANKTRNLYNQEMGIAEVRQRQQEEMLSNSILRGSDNFPRGPSSRDLSRQQNSEAADRRRWRIVQARQSPDVLYAGSRAASAHRAFPNVSTRTSASGDVTTIIESKSPASSNGTESSKADLSCLQSRSGRRLFIRAPKVPFAFVYRYERKKHTRYPYKQYLVAEYRCRRGFTMVPSENDSLFCRRMGWVGAKPQCVKTG